MNILKYEEFVNEVGNGTNQLVNDKIKYFLDKKLDKSSTSNPNRHQWIIREILIHALKDANFRSEAKKVYEYFERAAPLGISNPEEYSYELLEPIGVEIASIAKWDGVDIVNGIAFYMNMELGGELGNKLKNGLGFN